MHRAGCDPGNMSPADILCDFCTVPWDGESIMVEGHRGSCICVPCLRHAARVLLSAEADSAGPSAPGACVLCLRPDRDPVWRGAQAAAEASISGAAICRGCVRRSIRLVDPAAPHSVPLPSTAED
ncbi:MAG: hypothetical protein O2819_06165 [Planctomycetota bacterium]|nr:hypothetical protein [Planctomycetota bacterium]MDA1105171.1 hypothetical protein [Planctomycetota bacterium]